MRPWPWIITALASMLVYPTLDDVRRAFPNVDPRLIATTSRYRRSRAAAVGVLASCSPASLPHTARRSRRISLGYVVSRARLYRPLHQAVRHREHYGLSPRGHRPPGDRGGAGHVRFETRGRFNLMISIGAGTASSTSFACSGGGSTPGRWRQWPLVRDLARVLRRGQDGDPGAVELCLISTVASTTVSGSVTYLTRPPTRATLVSFYQRCAPGGPRLTSVRAEAESVLRRTHDGGAGRLGAGCLFVYSRAVRDRSFLYGKTSHRDGVARGFRVWRIGLILVFKAGSTTTADVIRCGSGHRGARKLASLPQGLPKRAETPSKRTIFTNAIQ